MGKIVLITGNDEFAVKTKAKAIVVEMCGDPPEDNPDLEVVQGDSEERKVEEILGMFLDSLRTPPFFSPRKVLWLKHFQYFDQIKSSSKNQLVKARADDITQEIKDGLPDEVTVVIDGPDLDRRGALHKACKAAGEVHLIQKPDSNAKDFSQVQSARIREICAAGGKRLEPRAERFLVETLAGDSGRMRNELEKLICHVGDADAVTLADCERVCGGTPEAMSWAFADALCEKNTSKALNAVNALVEQMRSQRGDYGLELSLLSSAVGRFQQMLELRAAAANLKLDPRMSYSHFKNALDGVPDEDERRSGILFSFHPYRAYRLLQDSAKFTDGDFVRVINELLRTNRRLVSGGGNPRIALERLILSILGAARPSGTMN